MDITSRLKIMSFLQYFIWGSWLVTLGSYMINTLHFTGANVGMVYSSKGLAAIIMPGIMGIIADKWLRAERAYMLCHLVCAGVLFYAASVTDADTMFWVMLVNAMAFMPTIALSNSVSYSCLAQAGLDPVTRFPPIRVFGTLGFIVAMWSVSLLHLELSNVQLYIASGASVLLTLYAFTLPKIPTAEKKVATTLASKLGLDAFVLFKDPRMALFFLFAMMLGAVLQITNVFGNPFLHDFARNPEFVDSFVVKYPSILLSVSQMAEVGFILTIPFFLKRFGIKTVMLMSMVAWTLRFGFFAFGDPSPMGFVLLLMSMIVYGCAFDFFNISGSVFVEQEVGAHIRASAQGLFMTMVNGVGAWVGSLLSGMAVDYFSVDGVKDWQTIWLVFAAYALALAVIFAIFFRYKHEPEKISSASVAH
ncbi:MULTISPECIES: nucleoside permease [Enterobacteriaceae]|uniref:MFS transporter n=1 Tax=Kluyvera genomosp. 2 TaxID=2774054 RepID=A0A2T2Y7S7_9ENTR|nr:MULTISPECIES: nucleoside permease [Enterobacteriaceae]HAT3916696.1 nucleoside permease [Kluyvera ascorbata]PSR48592.1 MFS transporter [Kluyvera genomosp. 2]BBR59862.1 nucleoside permease [Klebsiella sp. WP4-W18-ESBL-05]BBS90804.1 nucleoside permease [Klebsiella sp. WP7-S18-CRE-02]BBS95827.1 nucleoside permease [Klebsiella sp. WP7-S18-CRE-03]